MAMQFGGKRALVTGAVRGFGRAIAKKLAECGAETFALSRTQADLDSLKSEVPKINIINVELQDWYKTREEVSKIGYIHLLVNNAGVFRKSSLIDTPTENINNLDINYSIKLMIIYLLNRAGFLKKLFSFQDIIIGYDKIIAKKMIDNGKGGSIVNLSSILSEKTVPDGCIYSTTKSAIDMLAKCIALELGPHYIRVDSVNPTVVWTDMTRPIKDELMPLLAMTPMGRFPEIEDVVNAVVFLLSDQSGMISGECLRLDGGLGVH